MRQGVGQPERAGEREVDVGGRPPAAVGTHGLLGGLHTPAQGCEEGAHQVGALQVAVGGPHRDGGHPDLQGHR